MAPKEQFKPVDLAGQGAGAMSLEQAFKVFAAQKGSIDVNELATRLATVILEHAVRAGASDVHFDPTSTSVQLRFRIDGQLRDQFSYPKDDFPITARLRVLAGFPPRASTAYSPEDGRFEIAIDGRLVQFRASAFPTVHGDKLVLRVLDMGQNALDLKYLGFAPEVLDKLQALIAMPSGMFVVSGMTGCGKTTTLCSVLKTLSRETINIMTLEDPVEYILPRVVHSQINPKTGFTFAEGLRCILRQDPNVIMVGEIRDLETAEIALRAATTGHMIFSTVHTATAIGVVHRLIVMGIEPYLIVSALTGVLAQRLVRKVCAQCARPAEPDGPAFQALMKTLEPDDARMAESLLRRPGSKFLKGKGCSACGMTGYKGRLGVFELLVIDDNLRVLISNKANVVELRQAALKTGMKPLLADAIDKVCSGVTTLEEVVNAV